MIKYFFLAMFFIVSEAVCHENNDSKQIENYLMKINEFNFAVMAEIKGKTLHEEITILERFLKENNKDPDIYDFLLQNLSIKYSILGDHKNSVKLAESRTVYKAPKSYELDGFYPVDAVEFISKKAGNYDVVVINEAHNMSNHRTLTYKVLSELWSKGYRYLAVEGLSENAENLVHENYILKTSGFYTNEPVFANLLIHAKKIGFKLVSYDYFNVKKNFNIKNREIFAAETIDKKIFKLDKDAKIVIHVGYSHAKKSPQWLAGILAQQQKRKILSIDQTTEIKEVKVSTAPNNIKLSEPSIYENDDKEAWSLDKQNYDLTVVWPATTYKNNRPIWQKLNRIAHPFNTKFCSNNFPCVVEIFLLHRKDAVPLDRVVIQSHEEITDVFLHEGINTMVSSKANGEQTSIKKITCKSGICI
jgi:hypothetical protein